jgi:hypothetical protein
MPAPIWFDRVRAGNLRGWVISLITVLVAALLIAAIAAIAEWAPRPMPAATEEETSH